MRISDWSSDVCSSDLSQGLVRELSFDRSKTGHGLKRRRESRIRRVDLKFLPGFPILPCCRGHSRAVSIRATTLSKSAMAASNSENVAPAMVQTELLYPPAPSDARGARGRDRRTVGCSSDSRGARTARAREDAR